MPRPIATIPTSLLFKARKKHALPRLEIMLNPQTFRAYLERGAHFSYELEIISDATLTVTEPVYNTFKTFPLTLCMIGAIISLPSNDETLSVLENIVLCPSERVFTWQAFWILNLCDMGATTAVDTMKHFSAADKEVPKRWSASVSDIAAIPIFYLEQASNALDIINGDKNGVLVANSICQKSYLDLGRALGDAVGALDGPEHAEAVGITGLTVSTICSKAKMGLSVTSFIIKYV
ncbi:hypothetical protein BGW36DRAFT_431310 [Talaromyces proteolyticus]|uniref:Uncharacterized protein n=1 Tax=Talaromyces proteolyticus TaxID=1131652 RepID=A0AAD4KK24_9EURO|nr:uncharacterized protein BGW36DRAFT_431310 [Talaromyces proteolyticus]KAH8692078.1 hypothetical protein BGW36DRAFT_431310 [Talaromyces proteolyticus]